MFRAMIVDDEPLARENIEWMLAGHNEVEVVASLGNPKHALQEILKTRPDLLYLDMRMPGLHGLELLAMLFDLTDGKDLPHIIFVTAFDRYAVRAFEFHALDYLVKPFTEARFRQSLAYALERMHCERDLQPLAPFLAVHAQAPQRIVLEEDGDLVVLDREDVVWVESANHYLAIHTTSGQHIVRKTMAEMEEMLGKEALRIHRCILVNVIHVAGLDSSKSSGTVVRLVGHDKALSVSRRKVGEIRQRIHAYHLSLQQ